MFLGIKLVVLLAIVVVMLILRWRKVGMLTWTLSWAVVSWTFFKFGFVTPIPGSVIRLYMGIVLLSLFAYVTSDRQRQKSFTQPIVDLVVNPRRKE